MNSLTELWLYEQSIWLTEAQIRCHTANRTENCSGLEGFTFSYLEKQMFVFHFGITRAVFHKTVEDLLTVSLNNHVTWLYVQRKAEG